MFACESHELLVRMRLAAALLSTTALTVNPISAFATDILPTGGSVVSGQVSISAAGQGMTVSQGSDRAIVDWQGFSIGQGNSVNFVQPGASSAILNRVTGSAPSTIAGSLTANGQVFIINQNGIAITPTGTVKVGGGFVASTLDIDNKDFLAGNLTFKGNGASARISNEGVVTVGRGGYAALLGGTVKNSGLIEVPLGKVGLGSGEQATLDLSGDGFLQVAVPTKDGAEGDGSLVENAGTIRANGGTVVMKAATARDAARHAVNMSGTVEAKTVGGRNGAIVIGGGAGGKVTVSGKVRASSHKSNGGKVTITGRDIALKGAKIDVNGKTGGGTVLIGGGAQGKGALPHALSVTMDKATTITASATGKGNGGSIVLWSDGLTTAKGTLTAMGGADGGNGGLIETSGHTVDFTGLSVTTAATKGVAGNWLIDPEDLVVDTAAASTIQSNLANTGVTLQTTSDTATGTGNKVAGGAGDITINAPISWSANTTLTLDSYHSIIVNASITAAGTANVVLKTNNGGSGGDLSFGLTGSGFTGKLDFTGTQGQQTLTINGTAYTPLYSMADLDAIDGVNAVDGSAMSTYGAGLTGKYALAGNLDATGATYTKALVGVDGSNGFSGALEGLGHTVRNLTISASSTNFVSLVGFSLAGTLRDIGIVGGTISGADYVGGLLGNGKSGTNIVNAYATSAVSGSGYVGGLVGYANSGITINNAFSTGAVTGTGVNNNGMYAGGLVGYSKSSTIGNAYATGAVNGATAVGGLAGYAFGSTISNAYATGAVNGSFAVGGLFGYATNGNTISNVYATGAVTSPSEVGGLVGNAGSGAITNSYWNTETTGQSASAFGTGLTTAQMKSGTLPSGFSSSVWGTGSDVYPFLIGLVPDSVQFFSGTAYSDAGATALSGGTVNVLANGTTLGTASTGVNGYYYIARPAGTVASGATLLAYSSLNGVATATATGAAAQSGLDVYGNAVMYTTSATSLSSLGGYSAVLTSAKALARTATNRDSGALAAISAAGGVRIVTSGARFALDRATTVSGNTFMVQTKAAGAGITVASDVIVTAAGSLGLSAAGALTISSALKVQGAGTVSLAYGQNTTTPSATDLSFGLTGAGFTGGLTYLNSDGSAATAVVAGQALTINGTGYTLIYDMAQLDAIDGRSGVNNSNVATYGAGLAGNYALAGSLDASGTAYAKALVGTNSTGSADTRFSGIIEGLGHAVNNLTISGQVDNVGLIGYSTGTARDIGVQGGTANGRQFVGGLIGQNYGGTIANAYATGRVDGTNYVGGLVGASLAAITNVYATGMVTGSANVGGLAGFSNGTITNAYATGGVTGYGTVGGLVGAAYAAITNAYATGMVTGTGSVGGLVGYSSSTITNAYAIGMVTGTTFVGGLVGDSTGTVTTSYWDTQTSGRSTSDGGTDLTTGQMQASLSNMIGFIPNTWGTGTGLYPYLKIFFPNGVQAFSGTAYSDGGATALSSGTVTVVSNGATLGAASTGANGYYYLAKPAGAVSSGATLLAYSNLNGVATATATGAAAQSGLDVYGNAVPYATSATSLSALGGYAAAVSSAKTQATTAANGNSGALAAIAAAGGARIVTSGAGFALDSLTSLAGNTFVVQTTAAGAGITVASNITITSSGSLGLSAAGALTIPSALKVQGAGTVSLAYDQNTTTPSPTDLSFGLTDAGFTGVLTYLNSDGSAATTTVAGQALAINGAAYTLVYNMAQLDAIDAVDAVKGNGVATYGSGLAGNYALAGNLDATGTTYTRALIGTNSTGTSATQFSGILEGLTHMIANLTISGTASTVGLVGYSATGGVRDVGSSGTVSGNNFVGGLVGYASGSTITNVYATGTVNGSGSSVGGLIGYQSSGSIMRAFTTGTVSGGFSGTGGLVGTIVDGAVVTEAYATGAVNGLYYVGGLAGYNYDTITNAFATGSVSGRGSVGGLVGSNSGTISNAYSTGLVSPSGVLGGLAGYSDGTITKSFWNTQTSGQPTSSGGGTGLTTVQMQNPFSFINAGWDFASVWGKSTSGANGGYMMLRALSTGLYDDYVQVSDASRTYGDANAKITGGAVTGLGSANIVFNWGSAITSATNAGGYLWSSPNVLDLTDSRGGKTIYVDPASGKLTINKAQLTIAANDATKLVGTQATLGYSVSGLRGTDSVTGVAVSSAGADVNADRGTYAILAGSAAGSGLGNYAIAYVNGTLTVLMPASTGPLFTPTSTGVYSSSNWPSNPQGVSYASGTDGAAGEQAGEQRSGTGSGGPSAGSQFQTTVSACVFSVGKNAFACNAGNASTGR